MELSKTELQIIEKLAEGHKTPEIAAARFRSQETIKSHIKNARRKLGAKTIGHLIYLAFKQGLINSIFFALITSQILPVAKRDDENIGGGEKRRLRVSRTFSVRGGRVREDLI